jgi:hypothetical protein
MESILEPCSAWYVKKSFDGWEHRAADNSPGSDIPLNAITVTLATSGTLIGPYAIVIRH